MLNPDEKPVRQPLEDNLILTTAASEEDVERVAAFNGSIHAPNVDILIRNLFLHHPATRGQDLFFVVDEKSDEIVSSLCLIPWAWRYGEVEIPVGEMGMVGTAEAYRGRGLVRAQVDAFKHRLHQRGCLVSHIQGIPYFYRQFGYEYALPLEASLRLELRQVPRSPEPSYTFRRATPEDIPALRQLYDEAARDLTIHTLRDEGTWHYLQTRADGTVTERERWMIQDPEGEDAGYMSVQRHPFGEELTIDETARLGFEAALATLQHARKLAVEREKPGIRLNLPPNATLTRLAQSLEAHDAGTYAWQIHVPDVVALLRALSPVLEHRIADSPFAGLTQKIQLNLYRERVALNFESGHLGQVARAESDTSAGDVILRCPPRPFIPLVLGHRTWRDLQAAYPDVLVPPLWRLLADTLFPTVTSFLYSPY
jgi:hypothetical protein